MRNFKRSYNPREVEKLLKRNGWKFERHSGSHTIYTNCKGQHLTIKVSRLNPMILQRLVKENNLSI